MLIEIKNWKTGKVIFSYDCENNCIKQTIKVAINKGISLRYADLRFADLNNAYISKADLSYANFNHAKLRHAYFENVNLYGAILFNADISFACFTELNLSNADLSYTEAYVTDFRSAKLNNAKLMYSHLYEANLIEAHLNHADLTCARLYDAVLDNADLSGANLENVDLTCANLSGAITKGAKINYPMSIPEGEFIAWKKVYRIRQNDYIIVKLKILADSKRSRATSDMCRCDKALILGFETLKGEPLDIKEVTNYNYAECTYKVGEIVYPDKWDDNRWNECSHGIHFFLDRQSAVDYIL